MDSAKEIARGMLEAINIDGSGFWGAIGKGFISFPVSLAYLGYDFIDAEHRRDNLDDKFRLARLVKKGVFNHQVIEQVIKTSLEDFVSRIHVEKISSIVKNVSGSFMGKMAFTELTGVKLGEAIASRGVSAFLLEVWLVYCYLLVLKHPEQFIHQETSKTEILFCTINSNVLVTWIFFILLLKISLSLLR